MTGLERARRRRQRRTFALVFGALLVVGAGVTYAGAYVTGIAPGSKPPSAPASCLVTQPPAPQSLFTLNVYNASKDQGKAQRTSIALSSRNFNVGAVSNDPYGEKLDGVGEIRYGTAGAADAKKYVLPLFPGASMQEDGRTGTSVDLVLGSGAPSISDAAATPTPTLPANCASWGL